MVLLDLLAFDTVDYSVLLDCLHDWLDVALSALKLPCQHRNSHLHSQISEPAYPEVHFFFISAHFTFFFFTCAPVM